MRAKDDALVADLAQLGQRHHLEAAGVGEDRTRPVHERVQAAEGRDPLGARPQHQVIGVGKHDLGAQAPQLVWQHALDGRLRADRHEGRRLHLAVRRRNLAAAGRAIGRDQAEGEGVGHPRTSCPWRTAARSDAVQTRDPSLRAEGEAIQNTELRAGLLRRSARRNDRSPGSAVYHLVLHRVRDTQHHERNNKHASP